MKVTGQWHDEQDTCLQRSHTDFSPKAGVRWSEAP